VRWVAFLEAMAQDSSSDSTSQSIISSWTLLAGAVVLALVWKKRTSDTSFETQLQILRSENDKLKAEIVLLKEKQSSSASNASALKDSSKIVSDLEEQLKVLKEQKDRLEASLTSLQKRENETTEQSTQNGKEITQLRQENAKLISKYTTLLEENQQLKSKLRQISSDSERAIKDKESKLQEFQQRFDNSELQRLQNLKLSQSEVEQLKDTISKLEGQVKGYKGQLEDEKTKLKVPI
jgi:chromosome segregation ATPase